MDYGYGDKRKTKKDLRQKRINRGYKRGGQFRTMNVLESLCSEEDKKKNKGKKKK